MAHTYISSIGEGHATNRPPLFRGEDYNYWKTRMTLHIQSVDYELWKIVTEGNIIPKITIDGQLVPKPKSDFNGTDYALLQMNAKALNILYCGLDAEQFNKVSGCDSANEVWVKLQVTYEGTNQVKETKISMLIHEYELFTMKTDESISNMFSRFTNIINGLKSLGKVYSNAENVRKILRSLPESWDAKVTAIQEAKDLTVLQLDELLGSLLTHEIMIKSRGDKEQKGKKTLAFKSDDVDDESYISDDDDDEDFATMARNFKRFMKSRNFLLKPFKRDDNKGKTSKNNSVICFECNEPGHIKTNCPKLNKNKEDRYRGKKKALKAATWDDTSESSGSDCDDNKTANICFMADDDEVDSPSSSFSLNDLRSSYEELEENFFTLLDDFKILKEKAKSFRKENLNLVNQVNLLQSENSILKEDKSLIIESKIASVKDDDFKNDHISSLETENANLENKVFDLQTTLSKFTLSSQKLELLLDSQRCVFNKAGLGFEPKEKMYKAFFTKNTEVSTCLKCGKFYKDSHTCLLTKIFLINGVRMRKTWVQKGTKPPNF